MRVLKAVCCASAIVACLAPGARADEWNKKTYLTFSGPVQIPGATLPAGTYLFQLADPDNARHVVMVSSKDGTKIYGMFLTIPNERLNTPDENVVMFAESPAGSPLAVQAWWYPGDRLGEEFVYPKSMAMQIAKANRKSVLATDTEVAATGSEGERLGALRGSKVGRVDENGRVSGEPAAPVATAATGGTPATAPPTASAPQSRRPAANKTAVGTTGRPRRTTLPQTASPLSLIELLSGLTFAGAFATRLARTRIAAER